MELPTFPVDLYNLFLSHSWDTDARGRSTHERVRLLQKELTRRGWSIWFDEEHLLMGCNIDSKMAVGIKDSDAVAVCITSRYIEKINSQVRADNCVKEWNFAIAVGKKIIPLIFEEELLDVRSWPPGIMTMYLANTFYVDCTSDDVPGHAKKISQMLHLLGLRPRVQKSISWPMPRTILKSSAMRRTKTHGNVRTIVRL
jgi:hypothetical protein